MAPETEAETEPVIGSPQDLPPPAADTPVDNDVATAPPAAAPPPPEAKAETPAAEKAPVHYQIDLPPSAELKYDVVKVSDNDGAPYYGSGTISWETTGSNYQVTGEAHLLFISALNFKSEGTLDDYGIAPVLYSQKNFGRSETDTHFNRDERNSISFSSSKLSLPRKGGEQDRASVMWELAGIGRGDHEKFVPGAQINLFVAGDRDGDVWSIQVLGQEEIDTGAGKTMAWHVVRTPRQGTYEDKIDIWLAPQYGWCPVKIHFTYKKGGYLDMSMSSFHQAQLASTHAVTAR